MREKPVFAGVTVLLLAVAGLGSLGSCKKSKNDPPLAAIKTSFIQAVNVSPKTGELEAQIGDKKLPKKLKFLNPPDGYIEFQTKDEIAVQLTGANGSVMAKGTHTLVHNKYYTLIAYDTIDKSKKIKYVLLKDSLPSLAAGKTNVRFLHLSPDLPAVDIDLFKGADSLRWISAGSYLGGSPDVNALSFFKTISSGDYRVKVKTGKGANVRILFTLPSLQLAAGKSVTVYLKGLTRATDDNVPGLQILQHK